MKKLVQLAALSAALVLAGTWASAGSVQVWTNSSTPDYATEYNSLTHAVLSQDVYYDNAQLSLNSAGQMTLTGVIGTVDGVSFDSSSDTGSFSINAQFASSMNPTSGSLDLVYNGDHLYSGTLTGFGVSDDDNAAFFLFSSSGSKQAADGQQIAVTVFSNSIPLLGSNNFDVPPGQSNPVSVANLSGDVFATPTAVPTPATSVGGAVLMGLALLLGKARVGKLQH